MMPETPGLAELFLKLLSINVAIKHKEKIVVLVIRHFSSIYFFLFLFQQKKVRRAEVVDNIVNGCLSCVPPTSFLFRASHKTRYAAGKIKVNP